MKEDDYSEQVWNRLRGLCLITALNQSIVEERLPFGMVRKLRPLQQPIGDSLKILRAADFLVDLKDPYITSNKQQESPVQRVRIMSSFKRQLQPKMHELEPNQRYKFIQHKLISACESCLIVEDDAKILKFDPTALLFFKESGEPQRTNLTSNANGTVSNDKNQMGSILTQGCWLVSLNDLLNDCSISAQLPQVLNNKLRCMKYAEFLTQEGAELANFGNAVQFVAFNPPNTILMSRKQHGNNDSDQLMHAFIVDKSGIIKCSSKSIMVDGTTIAANGIYERKIDVEAGDLIILIRGPKNAFMNLEKITNIVLKCSLDQDFEEEILACLDKRYTHRPSALLVSRVHYAKEFDDCFNVFANAGLRIKYVSHLDSKIGKIVNNPSPGPFGCTTRHSAVYRDGYFVALHHDASKINRFTDTINYIIRKLGNPKNLGKRLEQESEDCVLKRISDVQYFAYVLRVKDGKFVLGLGGGAKCVVLSRDLQDICVYEVPILMELPGLKPRDQVILLSPHFPPTELIKTIYASSIQEWIRALIQISSVDLQSFKVSMIHFELD